MEIEEFIEEHRATLKGNIPVDNPDDDEIEIWILNDEGLYEWAVSEGVEV